MTIQIDPIEGAQRVTKADVEKYQKFDNKEIFTDEEWEELIKIEQNNKNVELCLNEDILTAFLPFRKEVFAVFYKNYEQMIDINTSNLKELHKIFYEKIMEKMFNNFLYATGKLKAIKSELTWEKNQSGNLSLLLNITEDEKKKIIETAPTYFNFNIEMMKEIFTSQKGKKPEELKFTKEEAESLVDSFVDGGKLREKNALVIYELYTLIISRIMDLFLFDISHFTEKEIIRLRANFIQDIYNFLSEIVNKSNKMVEPKDLYFDVPIEKK